MQAQFWRARANDSPEVTHPACRLPLPAAPPVPGCAPQSPDAVRYDWRASFSACGPRPSPRDARDARAGKGPPLLRRRRRPRRRAARHPASLRAAPFCQASHHLLPRTNPSLHGRRRATAPKICAARASTRPRGRASPARARPPTARSAGGLAPQVSAIHFRRAAVRRVRRNTFLSGCRPPWPPPRCPSRGRAFAPWPALGRSSPAEVRPSSRPALTVGRPLARARPAGCSRQPARAFGVRRRARVRPTARSWPRAAVLRDISAGTSYQTVRLVFRRYAHVAPTSCTSVRLGPSAGRPPGLGPRRRSSPSFGSHRGDSRVAPGARARASASPPRRAPWAVFQYGSEHSGPPHFRFSPPAGVFSEFPRGTVRYRPRRVLSLGCAYHPFALHYQAALLAPRARPGLSPALAPLSSGSRACATTPAGLPPGLAPVRSPLLGGSAFVSSPGLIDMLKSGPCSRAPRVFGTHALLRASRVRRARHRLAGLSVPCGGCHTLIHVFRTAAGPHNVRRRARIARARAHSAYYPTPRAAKT